MAVCNKDQARELLKLGVLFGPCRISVDDVDQSNMACGRVLVVEEMGEANLPCIISWLNTFEASSEDGIIVNIEELSQIECEEQFNEVTKPIKLCQTDMYHLHSYMNRLAFPAIQHHIYSWFETFPIMNSRAKYDEFVRGLDSAERVWEAENE